MNIEEAIRYFEKQLKECEEAEAWAATDPAQEDLLAAWTYEREALLLALKALRKMQDRMECRSEEEIK